MKVDTDTVTVVFGLVLNSSGLGALASLLESHELQDITAALRDAIKPDRTSTAPTDDYVEVKLQPLSRKLFSAWVALLHLLNISLLTALAAVLYIGPETVFVSAKGDRSDPLAPWELGVYWLWLFLIVIGYLVKGVTPTIDLLRLWRKAKQWIVDYRKRYGIRK